MTPTEALAQALHELSREPSEFGGHLCECRSDAASALAALAEHGMTVARTDDARDGEALRLLREALQPHEPYRIGVEPWANPEEPDATVLLIECECHGFPLDVEPRGSTFADACRKAIEAAR